ncbi:lasso peptide biosynthesis B2 protein [Actinoplanes sp. NPDC049596]|uniref:lasso peptide biosynthesis B2 protein n=1 Tax=unclassified Actinoplanes TaxID=2626549 RepID=UPI00342B2B2F
MTVPVVSEARAQLPWRRRAGAIVAAGTARWLVLLPPRRLRQILRLASVGARPATEQQAAQARTAVVTVSVRCAGQGCLQRSVATVLLCRLSGRWPDWCTGIRTQPFSGHAWVEVAGRPIGEPPGLSEFATVVAVRCPAGSRS